MNWNLILNALWEYIERLWNYFGIGSIIIIWLVLLVLIHIVYPFLKRILLFPKRKKAKRKIESFFNRDLKPTCVFLDHASGEYILNDSRITISHTRPSFSLIKNVFNQIPESQISDYRQLENSITPSYGVAFISHNRLQAYEADEAHWFEVQLYETDSLTKCILNDWIKLSHKTEKRLNQPALINSIFPFATSLHIAINLYFKSFGHYYILLSDSDSFSIDFEISPSHISGKKNLAPELKKTCMPIIGEKKLCSNNDISFTDIGFDSENMIVYIIGSLQVNKPPKSLNYKRIIIDEVLKEFSNQTPRDDKQELLLYSWINLRSKIITVH